MIQQQSQSLMRDVIQRIAVGPDRGKDISQVDAEQAMHAILQGHIDPVQTAVFLIALRMKRESLDEFKGLFQGLQAGVEQVTAPVDKLVCLADPFDGYVRHLPMSPFLPPVLSACGLNVLINGVETVGPKHGVTAHKVYNMAGLPVANSAQEVADCISDVGWGYLDQRQYAPILHDLLTLRDKIVKRTAITTLERLLMPIRGAQSTHMVLGYVHKAYPDIYTAVAQQAGYDSILLVKGLEGGLTPALNKPLRRFFVETNQHQQQETEKELLDTHLDYVDSTSGVVNQTSGNDAVEACLEQGLNALSGGSGVARDSLIIAAANILDVHQISATFEQAVKKVKNCLDNGNAKENFLNLQK